MELIFACRYFYRLYFLVQHNSLRPCEVTHTKVDTSGYLIYRDLHPHIPDMHLGKYLGSAHAQCVIDRQ